MPAEVINKQMRPARRDIYVKVMDDYGAEMHLTLPISMSHPDRTARIAASISTMSQGQASFEAAAAAEGMDISELKTVGLAKKAALKGQK
jgi:hypothetical protein